MFLSHGESLILNGGSVKKGFDLKSNEKFPSNDDYPLFYGEFS